MSDLDEEGQWEWNDERPLTYENWAKGQPDDYFDEGGEDCAEILDLTAWNDFKPGMWNDAACRHEKRYIC